MTHALRRGDRLADRLLPFLALMVALSLAGSTKAASGRFDDLRDQAQAFENNGQWLEACRVYDELIRKERGNVESRGKPIIAAIGSIKSAAAMPIASTAKP